MGDVGIHVPLQVLLVDEHTTDFKFNTLVGDRAHITEYGRESCYLFNRHIEQQIAGLLIVNIERGSETVIEETRAESDVV